MSKGSKTVRYEACYAAQIPALGKEGQVQLRKARVQISGTGRIGSAVALRLAEVGVEYISANDPQRVEAENLGVWAFAGPPDLGKEKVFMLESFFDGRSTSFSSRWSRLRSRRALIR